jgi:ribosomal protein S20
MPIIKSAIKRARQSLVRRSRNLQVKRAIKQDVTAVQTALSAGDVKDIQAKLSEAYSEIDRAVKKGTIHKNTAARRKSVLAHAVAKAMGAETIPAETKTTKGAGKKASITKTAAKKAPAAKKAAAAKKAPTTSKTSVAKKATTAKKPATKAAPKKAAEKTGK